jgi:hypothetical protein
MDIGEGNFVLVINERSFSGTPFAVFREGDGETLAID